MEKDILKNIGMFIQVFKGKISKKKTDTNAHCLTIKAIICHVYSKRNFFFT